MDWSVESPDVSPIEHIWSANKDELWNRRLELNSKEDVWRIASEFFFFNN